MLSLRNALLIVRTLSSLMLSVMLLMMGNSLFTTLIALRADIEGYPNEMIGLMTSAFFSGFAIGTLRAGPIINRVGHIRSFAAFAAITSAAMLSFLLILDPWVWVLYIRTSIWCSSRHPIIGMVSPPFWPPERESTFIAKSRFHSPSRKAERWPTR